MRSRLKDDNTLSRLRNILNGGKEDLEGFKPEEGYTGTIKIQAKGINFTDYYRLFPYFTTDGINEMGLTCNLNVVPHGGDIITTTGTNPGAPDMCSTMIPRYILDNARSVEDAILKISKFNIYSPHTDTLTEEFHYMIADSEKTVIIEFINNQTVIITLDELSKDIKNLPNTKIVNKDPRVMTNFHIGLPEYSKYAMGVERYNLLHSLIESGETDMKTIMQSAKYTNAYDRTTDPFWYTELCGTRPELTYQASIDNPSVFEPVIQIATQYFQDRDRDTALTWQTVHTSVYDMPNKSLSIYVQEDYDTGYDFTLGEYPEGLEKDLDLIQIRDFLWKGRWENYMSIEEAEKEIRKRYLPYGGALCSSVRLGDSYGRNLDWYYDNEAEIVTFIPKIPGKRYESLGVISCFPRITDEYIESEEDYRYFTTSGEGTYSEGTLTEIGITPKEGYSMGYWEDSVLNSDSDRLIQVKGGENLYIANIRKEQ